MTPFSRLNRFFRKLPVNLAVAVIVILWIIPTVGVFVSSFRTREAVRTTGWWNVFSLGEAEIEGQAEYSQYCASCHGDDGTTIASVNLADPAVSEQYPRSNRLLAVLRREIDGKAHVEDPPLPEDPNKALEALAPILSYMGRLAGEVDTTAQLGVSNYTDALVGYKGTQDYATDCEQGVETTLTKFDCNASDVLKPEGMGIAFRNTLLVAIPSAVLPIIFAAFAAYAFAWMDFPGRMWIFALLVGLQIVPLQMALVPIARLYSNLGLQNTFIGVWLFHTGFGLPYAIYLMRNFLGGLPSEVFESAYIDGANHWTAFWRLALPLSVPAIASLGIFQFLWIWNDFLVAKIFLPGNPVLTVQITNLIDPRGGNWHLLTGAAFLSFLVPMLIFFGLQRFFVRGLTAGAVKG